MKKFFLSPKEKGERSVTGAGHPLGIPILGVLFFASVILIAGVLIEDLWLYIKDGGFRNLLKGILHLFTSFVSSDFFRITGTFLVLLGFVVLVPLLIDATADYKIHDLLDLYLVTSVFTVVVCIIPLINWVCFKKSGLCLGVIILLASIYSYFQISGFFDFYKLNWWRHEQLRYPLIYKVIGFVLFFSFCTGIIFFLSKPIHRYFVY